ncbi:MAG TPA: hypothetical protein VGB14_06180 [Acidimicrobiales bacterium]
MALVVNNGARLVPRIRSVHPDLCTSETMATLSASAERTFVRLWTHCDDDGRCVDNVRLIKAAVYPLNDEMTLDAVEVDLAALAAKGLIIRYEVDGRRYLAVRSWCEFQHPQKRRPSKLPAPSATTPVLVREQSSPVVEVGDGDGEGEGVTPLPPPSVNERASRAASPPATVTAVFDAWRDATGHHRAVLDSKRTATILKALRLYPLEDVLDAVKGWRHDPHNRGENDRGRPYNDITLLLRDAEHIERFRDLERGHPRLNGSTVVPPAMRALERFVGRQGGAA